MNKSKVELLLTRCHRFALIEKDIRRNERKVER